MEKLTVSPTGFLYAAERRGNAYQIARYGEPNKNGVYEPVWTSVNGQEFYRVMEKEGAGHQESHEFYPDGVIVFYALDKQRQAAQDEMHEVMLADLEATQDAASWRGQ